MFLVASQTQTQGIPTLYQPRVSYVSANFVCKTSASQAQPDQALLLLAERGEREVRMTAAAGREGRAAAGDGGAPTRHLAG